MHIKAVADLLGALVDRRITGDVYGHTSDDTARTAVDELERGSRPVIVGGSKSWLAYALAYWSAGWLPSAVELPRIAGGG